MTELLKRWAQHEPERCSFDGDTCRLNWRLDEPGDTTQAEMHVAMTLAAVIEAIEARGWRLTLVHNPWREERPKWGAWLSRYEEGDLALARRDHEADTPAEAVLSAYVAALEAEAGQ